MEYYLIEQRDYCKLANRYLIAESNPGFVVAGTEDWIGEFEEETTCCQAFFLCQFR